MPKTVLHIVQHMAPGGIETMALELLRASPPNIITEIVSLEGTYAQNSQRWARLSEYKDRLHFLHKSAGFQLTTIFSLYQLFRKIKPCAVHTHHIGPLLYGGIAARLSGVPSIVHTEHDAWHLRENKRHKLQRTILGIVHPIVVADSVAVETALKEAYPRLKTSLILNGIDTTRFTPGNKAAARTQLGLPTDTVIIGCAARLETVKGHDILLKAMRALPQNVHLALAGIGSEENNLRGQAEQLGIKQRIHFLGSVADMPNFYRAIDVFCLPSRNEGLPLSPLEAQACDVPAILTDVGGCKEAICPISGMLVPAENPPALAEALNKVINREKTTSPRQFVVAHHDLHHMANAYNQLHLSGRHLNR